MGVTYEHSVPIYLSNGGTKGEMHIESDPNQLSVYPVLTHDAKINVQAQVVLREPVKLYAHYKQPTWSPDGRWIAFYRWEYQYRWKQQQPAGSEKDMGVYVIPTSGGEMRFLAEANLIEGKGNERTVNSRGLSWSPDSNKLAFVSSVSSRKGHTDIYIVDIDTKHVRPFTADYKGNRSPSWSPDGKYIAFRSQRGNLLGDGYATWVKPSEGGKAVLMTKNAFHTPIWSPDGKAIAYTGVTQLSKKRGVIICTVDEHRKLSESPILLREFESNRIMGAVKRWTTDGKIIYMLVSTLERRYSSINVYSLSCH